MTKPTALLLADDLEKTLPHSAAYELRRQHKLIGELVEALNALYVAAPLSLDCRHFHHSRTEQHNGEQECKPREDYLQALAAARAVLLKAKE